MEKLLLFLCLLYGSIGLHAQSGNEYIDKHIFNMQSSLPLKVSENEFIINVAYKDHSLIQTHELSQKTYFNLSKVKKVLKKEIVHQFVSNRDLMDLIVKGLIRSNSNMEIKYICRGTGSGLSFSITITPDDFLDGFDKL